jgi:transcription elongation factor GreA
MVFVCAPRNFAGAKERNDLNMANMKKEYKMSAERKEELQKELTYLKTVREKEVADLIKEARGFGDLSENSEYDEAKNEQGKLYSRIAEVEEILLHTVIVDENDAGTNSISIGCRVTVQDVKSGRELPEYKVVGSQEADPMHRAISEDSPFGKALMGAKEGDEVMVEAPVGTIVYRIVKIER